MSFTLRAGEAIAAGDLCVSVSGVAYVARGRTVLEVKSRSFSAFLALQRVMAREIQCRLLGLPLPKKWARRTTARARGRGVYAVSVRKSRRSA